MTSRSSVPVSGRSDISKTVLGLLCKNSPGLKICHFNAQSLLPKSDEFIDIFAAADVHFIFVSETWFKASTPVSHVLLPHHKLYRNDRSSHGGGVAIYTSLSIPSRVVGMSSPGSEVEFLFVEATIEHEKCLFGCVYKPPKVSSLANIDLDSFLSEVCHKYVHVCIGGDLNFNLLYNDSSTARFSDFVYSYGLNFVNTSYPTYFASDSSSLLDIFLLSDNKLINYFDQISLPAFSKHDLIFLSLNLSNTLPSYQCFSYRDFRNVDLEALLNEAYLSEWNKMYSCGTSIDDQVAIFNSLVISLYDKFLPTKTKTIYPNNFNVPWFTRRIKLLCADRDKAYRIWKRFRSPEASLKYRRLRNKVTTEIRKSKKLFFENKFNSNLPSRVLWKNLQYLGIGRSYHSCCTDIDPNELNRIFTRSDNISQIQYDPFIPCNTDGFTFCYVEQDDVIKAILSIKSDAVGIDGIHPKFIKLITPVIVPHITRLFNNIILRSTFPSIWKLAKVVPVPKKSKSNTPEYRPIAILPFLAKAFEKVVAFQITSYINKANLLSEFQSGFRQHRSCTSAVLKVTEDIRVALDDNMITILVMLDFSKAFDSVDHLLLVQKLLSQYAFSSTATKLILTYLSNRSQCVSCDNITSGFLPNVRGVPQGSILGPLLFVLFINDVCTVLQNVSYHLYADDLQIYISCPIGLLEDAVVKCNEALTSILNWATLNKLMLNASKSICIPFFRNSIDTSDFPVIKLGNDTLPFVTNASNLGIRMDSNLSWSDHVNTIVSKVFGILRKLSSSAYFTPIAMRLRLVKCLVIPVISYGCEVYAGMSMKVLNKLEICFNAAVRYIFSLKKQDHVSVYRDAVFGSNLYNFLKFRSLLYLSKILSRGKPDYLVNKINLNVSSRSLHITPLTYKYLVTERQFFIRAIRLWNELPLEIRRQYRSNNFKSILHNHFSL